MAMLIAAFPFAFIMIGMCISLLKALKSEHSILKMEEKQREQESDYRREQRAEIEKKREEFNDILPNPDEEQEEFYNNAICFYKKRDRIYTISFYISKLQLVIEEI